MDRLISLLLPIFILGQIICETPTHDSLAEESENVEPDFYTFSVTDTHGDQVSLEKYRGKVTLVVNVASECGFTDDHYKGLVKVQNIFNPTRKFNILAFPCNDFGHQEPKENHEILHFVEERYQVNFPLFAKIKIIGDDVPESWKYLIERSGTHPNWNFWKYLVDQDGQVIGTWGPWTKVEEITRKIKDAVDIAMKATGPKRPLRGEEAMEPFMGAHNNGEQYAEGAQYENLFPGESHPDRRAGGKPAVHVQPPEPIRAMPPEPRKPKPSGGGPGVVSGPQAPSKQKNVRTTYSSPPAPGSTVKPPASQVPPPPVAKPAREDL